MRKFLALALAAMMLLALAPTAFAAANAVVENNWFEYYDEDGKVGGTSTRANGGITYIQENYDRFVKWQVPGNVLTGAENTYNVWIHVVDEIRFPNHSDGNKMYIDGYPYEIQGGYIQYSFYTLPVKGGNTVTRTLLIYDAKGAKVDTVTVSLVYEDRFTVSGSVATVGINQANTYAKIEYDGVNKDATVVVQVVYSNLIAKTGNSNAYNAAYSTISYYPIEIEYQLLDPSGNKYPDYTRVDITNNSSTNLAVNTRGALEEVANQDGWFYMMDSTLKLVKRYNPNGTQGSTLSVYKDAAEFYAGLRYYELNDNGTVRYYAANEPRGYKSQTSIISEGRGSIGTFGGMTNASVLNSAFDAMAINSWKTSDVSTTSSKTVNETAIIAAIDLAIADYYTDAYNAEVYGAYAMDISGANSVIYTYAQEQTHAPMNLGADDAIWQALAGKLHDIYNKVTGGTLIYGGGVYTATSGQISYTAGSWKYIVDEAVKVFGASAAATDFRNAGSDYSVDKLTLLIQLLTQEQIFTTGKVPSPGIETKVDTAKKAYRAAVDNLLKDTLQTQSTVALGSSAQDSISIRLTTPSGVTSAQPVKVRYDSVSRVEAKKLTSIEGASITVKVGETKAVTVKAYQDQVPVTGLPIKFKSNDATIATATSPADQNINSNTTEITGVKVGSTIVRAYLDTTNDTAEAYIIVNVVEDTPDVVAPVAPETTDFVCKVRKLWIREGAGTSYTKVGYFSRNDIAKVYEVVNGWAKLDYNGGIAYSSTGNGKYLSPK